MVVRQDWLYKQIQGAVQIVARLVFKKSIIELVKENKFEYLETERIYARLISMINNNEFTAAEDLLFDSLDPNNNDYLKIALDFYSRLNEIDSDTLEDNDFSRDEIENGLNDVLKIYDVTLP